MGHILIVSLISKLNLYGELQQKDLDPDSAGSVEQQSRLWRMGYVVI